MGDGPAIRAVHLPAGDRIPVDMQDVGKFLLSQARGGAQGLNFLRVGEIFHE